MPQPTVQIPSTSSDLYDEWTKVAICEEGGWGHNGFGAYVGDLGISAANWYGNGGGSDLSPAAQIAVAERIQSNPPDQNGCNPGGW